MTELVQVAVTGDVTEAEEIQVILAEAGIEARIEPAVDHHPAETEDGPKKVLVPGESLEAAQDAIEAMTEPDELVSDA